MAVNVVLATAYFLLPTLHLWLWGVLGLGASAATAYGTFRNRPRHKQPWLLLAVALLAFVIGDTTYNVLTQFLHQDNPFPSLADAFYLLTYPLFAAGLLWVIRCRRAERDPGPMLDALTITVVCALLSWIYLIEPLVGAAHTSLFAKVISVAYPLGDILILCVLARLVLSGGGMRNQSVVLLSLGGLGLLGADVAYGAIQLDGTWHVGGPTDMGWVLFYVLWGTAALHTSMRELTERQPHREEKLGNTSLWVLSCTTMVAPLLLLWRVTVQHSVADIPVIALAAAILFALVMARLSGLARAQALQARRERALRANGELLVAATDIESVYAAALDAVTAVVGSYMTACLIIESRVGTETVVNARPPHWAGRVLTVGGDQADGDVVVGYVDGSDGSLGSRWTLCPLSERDRVSRRILIGHRAPLPAPVVETVKAVGVQVTLAIEGVEQARLAHQRRSEARFRSLIQNASDVIVVVQPNGEMRAQTPSLHAVLGYRPEELSAMRIDELVHPSDSSKAVALIEGMLAGSRTGSVRTDWRVRHATSRWVYMEVIGNDLSGDSHVGGVVLTLRDVSDQKALEAELRHQAFHDDLTNLANRVLFSDRVGHALSQQPQLQTAVAVFVLDIDDFKLINDTLGHGEGDELLVQVAGRLSEALRLGDTAARLGGDEFAVCAEFESGRRTDVASLAEHILASFARPFIFGEEEAIVRVSIGISVADHGAQNVTDMLREADLALYAAKEAGKNEFRFFEPELHRAVLARLERRTALKLAIQRDELRVFYQPIVRLADGEIVGFEALVRWQHPELGLVPPIEFIDIAEESWLIVPIGQWVLNQSCQDLARWRDGRPERAGLAVSVNLSPRQLQSASLLGMVDEALARFGLSSASLKLEITEIALVQDSVEVLERLQGLRERGIVLALDDFGTGYSSLSYLHRFPIQALKIDRSFVVGMDKTDTMAVLDAIVSMAESLGLELIAEGIETETQALQLAQLGCTFGQGYLFSRPVPSDKVEELLADGCVAPNWPSPDERQRVQLLGRTPRRRRRPLVAVSGRFDAVASTRPSEIR